MDTGRCRIAPLPGMGEGLKLRRFTGDWLLVQGNGEILSDDFAQLINRSTCEVLRIRPGMFGGEKMHAHRNTHRRHGGHRHPAGWGRAGVPLPHRLLGLFALGQ